MMTNLPKILRFAVSFIGLASMISGTAEARSWVERLDHRLWGEGSVLSEAYDAYDGGRFLDAAKSFEIFGNLQAGAQEQIYNAGVAAYKAGKSEDAVKHWERAVLGEDPKIKAMALHNLASVHIEKKELEPARDQLKNALAYDNDNKAIQENLAWVEEQLKKQDPQSKDDKKNEQKKDNQKQDQNQAQNQDKKDKSQESDKKDASQNQKDQDAKGSKDGQQSKDQKNDEKSADNKKGQEGESGKDQEQKKDGKSQASNDQSKEQGEKKDAQGSSGKDKSEEAKAAEAKAAGKEDKDGKDKGKEAMALDPKNQAQSRGQTILTPAELKNQEAERLLRTIDDKIGAYPLTDTEATGERGKDGKNW